MVFSMRVKVPRGAMMARGAEIQTGLFEGFWAREGQGVSLWACVGLQKCASDVFEARGVRFKLVFVLVCFGAARVATEARRHRGGTEEREFERRGRRRKTGSTSHRRTQTGPDGSSGGNAETLRRRGLLVLPQRHGGTEGAQRKAGNGSLNAEEDGERRGAGATDGPRRAQTEVAGGTQRR